MFEHISNQNLSKKWIAEIPHHWNSRKLKFVAQHVSEKRLPIEDEIKISPENVESQTGKILDYYSKYETEGQIFQDGDVLFNKLGVHLNKVVLCKFNGLSMGEMIVIRPDSLSSSYLFRVLNSFGFIDYINSLSEGVILPRAPVEGIFSASVPIPPDEEQSRISCFLDKKTKQIDTLIEKIQRKIELLKEQRTALINQCVTKGLDPNVEMKDSGVEWIGEIPKHWHIERLAVLGSFSKGKNITKSDLADNGEPVILYGHLYTTYDRVVKEPVYFISEEKASKATKISKGTFLFTTSGESVEEIGKSVLFFGEKDTNVGGDALIYRFNSSNELDPEYFSFCFNSKACQDQKSPKSRGEIVVHIYERQIREVKVGIPPISEQNQIKDLLKQTEDKTARLVNAYLRKIELLQEYRQSLISEAVTGKFRVTEDMI